MDEDAILAQFLSNEEFAKSDLFNKYLKSFVAVEDAATKRIICFKATSAGAIPVPKTYEEALASPWALKWKEAMQAEIAGRASHLSTPSQLAFYEAVGSAGPDAMYVRAIYWAFATMSGTGYGDVVSISLGETIYATLAMSVGTSFFLFTVFLVIESRK